MVSSFSICVFQKLKSRFLTLEYQKHTLIGTIEHYIVNNDKSSGLLLSCDMCKTEIIIIIKKALTYFTSIMLNDYTTAQSDKALTTKIAKKISKLS